MQVLEIDRVVLVTDRFEAARERLSELFNLSFDEPYTTEVFGHTMKVSHVPGILELYTTEDDEGPVAEYLEDNGPGVYCVVFRVDDVEEAKSYLEARDVFPIGEFQGPAHEVFYHPSDFFNMFTVFIEYSHPLQR